MKRISDSEFEVMEVIWNLNQPVSSTDILSNLPDKNWKAPTVISFMKRLEEKGFLKSEKVGKERLYHALIAYDDYLKFETEIFYKQYHKKSFASLLASLYPNNQLTEEEIEEIRSRIQEKR